MKMTSTLFIIAFGGVLSLSACASSGSPASASSRTDTYCSPGGEALKMKILGLRPELQGEQALVLYIHGGGWNSGDYKSGFERRRLKPLMKAGFAVATIDYRLAPQHTHPAHIQDSKCAVRYLKTMSAEIGISPNRIGVMGDSAGGHLAAMVGLSDSSAGFDVGEHLGVTSRVKAVTTFYGLFDLVNVEPSLAQQAIPPAFPSQANREAGSPLRYITPEDPPFLIIHGKNDRFVDVAQSVKLTLGLKEAGHDPLLVAVDNAGHGLVKRGGKPAPDNTTIDKLMTAFFFEHLTQ